MAHKLWNNYRKQELSFKHVGSLSYTADDILIYTLYIAPPLKKNDSNKLKQYFSKFGEIESVKIITKKNNLSADGRSFSFGFVCFKEAESASKALRCKEHYFRHKILTVRSADSWKQPFQKTLQKASKENIENENQNSNYSILNLNDDCLFIIFKYLSFHDQIKMSTLSTRLAYIFELTFKTTKTLDMKNLLSLKDFRQGLQKMGHHLENFSCGFSTRISTRFIEFVSMFCPNLNKLQVDSISFQNIQTFRKISTNLQNIRHLELQNCSINDEMINLLSGIKFIEHLDLTDNKDIAGTYLHKFENVKTLILSSCSNIQSTHFAKMCLKTTGIKQLDIRRGHLLNSCAIKSLVENLNLLENLAISTVYKTNELENIVELKNLKHLTINSFGNKTEELFSKLAKDKNEQLETLKVTSFNQSDIKANSIIELKKLKQLDLPFGICTESFIENLSNLKELKILNIPGVIYNYDCILKYLKKSPAIEFMDLSRIKPYDDDFIKKVIEILKKQRRSQPLTLKIKLEQNCTEDNNEERLFLKENKSILRIDSRETRHFIELVDPNFYSISDDEDYSNDSDDFDIESDDDFGDDFDDDFDWWYNGYNGYGFPEDDSDEIDGIDDISFDGMEALLAYYAVSFHHNFMN